MRLFAVAILAVAAAATISPGQAKPVAVNPGVAVPAHGGGRWVGGPYRPGYGYGGWRYGYPGWRYGYPGYGFGWGVGYGAAWGFGFGYPWYGPAPVYAYPYGYTAPVYGALEEPPVYIQQPPPETAAPPPERQAASRWYYCTEPAGYYPYVKQCSRPWIAVQPTTPP